jgi:RimJ/RimL family protein N-acetyltransferase
MARTRTQQRLLDPGAMLAATHELPNGGRVRLRLTRPSDTPRVRAFLERLSPETRRRRFLIPMPEIPERMVRHFTFYDPRERLMIAATVPVEGVEEIVGLADVALLETGVAEIGLVVDDDHQGSGVGALLSEAVASLALTQGAFELRAEMVDGNPAMLKLMERLGPTTTRVERGVTAVHTRLSVNRRLVA